MFKRGERTEVGVYDDAMDSESKKLLKTITEQYAPERKEEEAMSFAVPEVCNITKNIEAAKDFGKPKSDFIKLTGTYGPLYIRKDQIISVMTDYKGHHSVYAGIYESHCHVVKETPEEVIALMET